MNKPNQQYQNVFDKISRWLKEASKDEKLSIMNWVHQADEYIKAAEDISVNEYQLSVKDFKRDLLGFYKSLKQDAEQSLYLKSLQEGMWQHLAHMTDQSQVEWSELLEDFNHDGVYQAGEVIGFGQIICQQCQHQIDIHHATTILPCPKCQGKTFTRKGFDLQNDDTDPQS
ncbi:zinc ribbon-containing protein [Thalassotalea aquiviva]|uniref:zinc ribbon-containing protein n=1 Tax=Thalassotalea aquiviva TaxID=3242415 RepID=UPI00352B4FA0